MVNNQESRYIILLACPPGDLQIGLQALLRTHLNADVLVVGELSSLINLMNRQEPDLVILDQDISRDAAAMVIMNIKTRWPGIPCLVLINDDQNQNIMREAGCDHACVKGLKGTELVGVIKDLLY